MIIYSFADLTEVQRKQLYDYIINYGSNYYFDSYDEMVKDYTGPVFNKGTTYYTLWDGYLLKGTIGIITKDVPEKGEVFITAINILEQDKANLKILLQKAIENAIKENPEKLKLGIHSNKKYLIPIVEEMGFNSVYKAVILKLESADDLQLVKTDENIAFKNLSEENKYHFKDVHNSGFLKSPNGSILTGQQIDEMLTKNEKSPVLSGICYFDNIPAGIYELNIKEKVGWIESIAIAPEWQGNGIGKIVLKKAVDTLCELDLEEIKLFVISSNERAYKLYLKYGFIEEKVTSFWFEMNVK